MGREERAQRGVAPRVAASPPLSSAHCFPCASARPKELKEVAELVALRQRLCQAVRAV